MASMSLADVLTSLVTSVVGTLGNLLCSPLYGKIKASMEVVSAPGLFSEDVKKLSDLMDDVRGMSRSDYIDKWFSEAEKVMEGVPQVLMDSERSSSQNHSLQLSCCIFSHGLTRCKLHKKVRKLTVQGQNIITCTNLNAEPVEHIRGVPSIEDGSAAGKNLKQVLDSLNDDDAWIIGLWGPGGVGKTTLVNALNNKLKNTFSFTLVKLIPLTKDVNESQLQKAIAESLELRVEDFTNTKRIADEIYNRLQRKKFLLILDNVWESFNLASIGIPENQKGSKVIVTTRLQSVCRMMKARAIKIGYLTKAEAWQLFFEKAGDEVNNPDIRPLAEVVCDECGGLPLALVAVGSAMRGETNIHLWQSAINDLRSSIFLDGVESQVYLPLKLSYDFLPNDTLKACFLYCCLYPQGYEISVSELVQCWLAENIINEQLNYQSAYCKGLDLIEKLKSSCLLEDGLGVGVVKMHDVVRDVAIQIGKSNETFIVFSGHGISKSPRVTLPEEFEKIKWISFVDNRKIELPAYKKVFPKVTTIIVCKTEEHVQVSNEFLQGFPTLRVLRMAGLQSFPSSPLHLAELRALFLWPHPECLPENIMEELPCGEKLMALNIPNVSLGKLPKGVETQTNLKVLDLSYNNALKTIEVDVMLNLSALEILDMEGSGYKWPTKRKHTSKEVTLQDLSGLRSLKEVYLQLADVEATYADCSWIERLETFIFCYENTYGSREGKVIYINQAEENKVGSLILHANHLVLYRMNVKEIFTNFSSTDQSNSKLKSMALPSCLFSEELKGPAPSCSSLSNLESLCIRGNDQLRSFNQIAYSIGTAFPQLRSLEIEFCSNITEVFRDGPTETHFVVPKLKLLDLYNLRSLQRLCNLHSSEQLQSVEVLQVSGCPNLKKLPPMPSIKEIEGVKEWWNNLEWDSPHIKSYMIQFFKPRN